MHFGNSAGNFGGSAVRRPVGYDSAAAMSKLVALLLNYMQIVQNWSEKGVYLPCKGKNDYVPIFRKTKFFRGAGFRFLGITRNR